LNIIQKNAAAIKNGFDYIANPLNSYLLIKRLTSDWSYVESLMRNNMADVFLTNISSQRDSNNAKFPDDEDLKGAAIALMRLQDTYRLETRDMAQGKIQGVKRADELQAHDCFELGRIAYNQADYYHTLMWMQEAMNRMEHESPPTATEVDILEYLAFAMYQQGNVKRALSMTKRLKKLDPTHPRADGNIKYYEDMLVQEGYKKGDDGKLPPIVNQRKDDGGVNERDIYESLCRGEKHMSKKDSSKLYCYYKRDKPFLRLAPIKAEIVHWKPKMILFRQVVSDEEIEIIKEMATPRLKRATVKDRHGTLVTVQYRIAKSAWLKPEESSVIARISKRQDDMTDLNMDTAEDLQIANYGLGGHYDPHYDFARKDETNAFKGLNTGNRIATILTYLSTPEAGGATVFPELKISLFPSKNDAVFWFNLLKSGEGDMTTRHAACPVLAGNKWVSNRWIHERGQEFRRPCDIDENAYE
jgi:prolyl 4-hydroxylase